MKKIAILSGILAATVAAGGVYAAQSSNAANSAKTQAKVKHTNSDHAKHQEKVTDNETTIDEDADEETEAEKAEVTNEESTNNEITVTATETDTETEKQPAEVKEEQPTAKKTGLENAITRGNKSDKVIGILTRNMERQAAKKANKTIEDQEASVKSSDEADTADNAVETEIEVNHGKAKVKVNEKKEKGNN